MRVTIPLGLNQLAAGIFFFFFFGIIMEVGRSLTLVLIQEVSYMQVRQHFQWLPRHFSPISSIVEHRLPDVERK